MSNCSSRLSLKCQIPLHTGIPSVFLLGQVSCANAPSHRRPSSYPGCDCGQVLFRCALGLQCSLGHRCCQCCSLFPLHTQTLSHTHRHCLLQAFTIRAENMDSNIVLHILLYQKWCGIDRLCVCVWWSRDERRENEGMCVVQFSGCSRSLCRAAGCAYLLLRSVEHEKLKTSWKGPNPVPPYPCRPHLPTHPSPPRLLASLGPTPRRPALLP